MRLSVLTFKKEIAAKAEIRDKRHRQSKNTQTGRVEGVRMQDVVLFLTLSPPFSVSLFSLYVILIYVHPDIFIRTQHNDIVGAFGLRLNGS